MQLSGVDRNPSIAGNFIAFENQPTPAGPTDLFVYDLVTNRLYQITNTPTVTEQLNDITVLADGSVRVVWASDEDGLISRNVRGATFSLQAIDNEPPIFTQPDNIIVNVTMLTGALVNYTVHVTDNIGVTSLVCTPASGSVFPIGTSVVQCTAGDASGNTADATFTVTVLYNFSGFLQLVDGLPTLNVVGAGQAVPVKFSLSGNNGLNIFAAGYPVSSQIACDANEPGAIIEETVTAGGSSLSYDAVADRYTYVWKTEKAWKGTCRILALRLLNGCDHYAKFRFK